MKNSNNSDYDKMRDEYDLSDSIRNPFAAILKKQKNLIELEPDVAKYYKNSEQVNKALRAIISAYPAKKRKSASAV